jgi:hypothetical protein
MLAKRSWVAASSRSLHDVRRARRPLWPLVGLVIAAGVACSVGHGSGDIDGTVYFAGCRREGPYALAPNAFFAETAEQLLSLRVQRGGNVEVFSDGISVLVRDAALVKTSYLGVEIDLAEGPDPLVEATAFFNDTCPSERDRIPVLLKAVSGSVRFDAIYAPQINKKQVRITAQLTDVRFEDPERPAQRWAELSGFFDFLYVRGSPAQHFP